MGNESDDGSAAGGRMHASHQLLMFMLAERTPERVQLSTDRCPRCGNWLAARWVRGTLTVGGGYLQKYALHVSCGSCGYDAQTQHEMNRSG